MGFLHLILLQFSVTPIFDCIKLHVITTRDAQMGLWWVGKVMARQKTVPWGGIKRRTQSSFYLSRKHFSARQKDDDDLWPFFLLFYITTSPTHLKAVEEIPKIAHLMRYNIPHFNPRSRPHRRISFLGYIWNQEKILEKLKKFPWKFTS